MVGQALSNEVQNGTDLKNLMAKRPGRAKPDPKMSTHVVL